MMKQNITSDTTKVMMMRASDDDDVFCTILQTCLKMRILSEIETSTDFLIQNRMRNVFCENTAWVVTGQKLKIT